jgi:hypothetical protein
LPKPKPHPANGCPMKPWKFSNLHPQMPLKVLWYKLCHA